MFCAGTRARTRNAVSAPPEPSLDVNVLTLCFARRMAEYKRAVLLFSDPDRLAGLVNRGRTRAADHHGGKGPPA